MQKIYHSKAATPFSEKKPQMHGHPNDFVFYRSACPEINSYFNTGSKVYSLFCNLAFNTTGD